jgi:uncharacterized integral membrane protein
MSLGKELRFCPRKHPSAVWGMAGVIIGGLLLALMVAIMSSDGMTAADRNFLVGTASIFLGIGGLLLVLRRRVLAARLAFRIHEGGVVRETRSERRELLFASVARLRVGAVQMQRGGLFYTIDLVGSSGEKMRLQSVFLDNVDADLVHLLEQRSGLAAERLHG